MPKKFSKEDRIRKLWSIGKRSELHITCIPEYKVWRDMTYRCTSPRFKNYFGRGITVCREWKFSENFLVDMGPRPSRFHSIERIDNKKGYSPDNCKWATRKDQNRNRRGTIKKDIVNKVVSLRKSGVSIPMIVHRTRISVPSVYLILRGAHWSYRK